MANSKIHNASENERFKGWSWEVLEPLAYGGNSFYSGNDPETNGVNVIDGCRLHFLVDIPTDFPGEFTGQPETLLTDRRFKHGTERTISNRYYTSYRYLSAWHIRNGTKAIQGGFDRFYNNIFRWKSSENTDINDFGAWENFAEDNSLADTALPAGYPGFETAVVYEQGNGTLGLPYNMGADAGSNNNIDHDYPPYKYHCDAANLIDVHDIAKYLDRPNTETAETVMTNAPLPSASGDNFLEKMFSLAWQLDATPSKTALSGLDPEAWIRSRLQIEQYDLTFKTYLCLPLVENPSPYNDEFGPVPTVEDQGEVTWIIKNVTPQHLYDPTRTRQSYGNIINEYPEPYLYGYILTPTKIRPVQLRLSRYSTGTADGVTNYAYNHPATSLSPGGIQFSHNNDEVLFGDKVPWCDFSMRDASEYTINVEARNVDHWSVESDLVRPVMMPSGSTQASIRAEASITVKGMDANHNILATDTETVE